MAGDFFKAISQTIDERRKRQADLEDALAVLQLKQQMDPEMQAKQLAMQTIQQQNPAPELRMSRTISPQNREMMQGRLQEAQQGQRSRVLEAMQKYGLLPGGMAGGGVNVFAFDPNTGTVAPAEGGQGLARGSRIMPTRTTPDVAREMSQARAEGTALGQRETPERAQAASAIDSMLASLDSMEQLITEDPSRLATSKIPFMEREFAAVMNQFDKEAAIAAGGKQLTTTELNLIRNTRPTMQDMFDPGAIQLKIDKLRSIGRNAQSRLSRTSTATPSSTGRIRVRLKSSGQTGTIDPGEFDAAVYERL